jgi:Xaa-Pro aminopeptidase
MAIPKSSNIPSHALSRFEKIFDSLKTYKLDAILLNFEPNVSYSATFFAPDTYSLITQNEIILITDFRYMADFKKKAQAPVKIIEIEGTFYKTIVDLIKKRFLKKIGFESRHLTFAECEAFHKALPKDVSFIPLKETIEPLRQIKDSKEISIIREATKITLDIFEMIPSICKPGATELQVAAEIERAIRLKGASTSAFDIIVASGPNSSYPHASITNRIIQDNENVVIDMGVDFKGYKSDLTRTLFLGRINGIVKEAYKIVREAQQRAIKAIRPGVSIKSVDEAARNYIEQKGFGKFFGHALGHGIGLEVHESPSINKRNKNLLETGSVFTIEPGIYKTEEYGIRIEDIVLVTSNGAEVISGNARD